MKLTLAIAALISAAFSQYTVGGTGSVTLPGTPTGTSSGSTTTSTLNIEVPVFPSANTLSLQGGSTSTVITANNAQSAITAGRIQNGIATDSMPALFVRHPSSAQQETFANTGDTAAILTTLKGLASDDSVPCGDKVQYLLQLQGIVKNAIARKNLAADQLAAIINSARAEIARLQDEIKRTQTERDNLRIPDIESRIADLVAKLNVLYNQITTIKNQIPPEQARIVGFENEINTYNRQNDDERNRISNDKLKLTQTDNLIKDLENRLKEARDQKAALEASIAASQALIKDNDAKIANIRNTIADIQAKIKGLNDTVDRLRRDSNTLEVDLERARSDLSVAQVKDKKLADDIKNLQARIADQQPRLVDDDLNNLRTLIGKLNSSLPSIQAEIDREYYYCYGAGKVTTETTGNTIVYVVKGEAFGTYLQSAYGQNVWAPSLRTGGDYRLQVVDTFGPAWVGRYGSSSVGSGSCFTGAGVAGQGTITAISGSGFEVKNAAGKKIQLSISPCTRVESAKPMPAVGDSVAWIGTPSSAGGPAIVSGTESTSASRLTCW